MTEPEIAEALSWMRETLFPKWEPLSVVQVQEWAKLLRPFTREQFETGAKEHYFDQGNFKNPVLKDLANKCWEIRKRETATTTRTMPDQSLALIVRKATNLQGPDWEVLMRYYRMLWIVKAQKREDHRKGLQQQCYNALVATGMAQRVAGGWDFSQAERASQSIFGEPHEFCEDLQDIARSVVFVKPGEDDTPMPRASFKSPQASKVSTPSEQLVALVQAHVADEAAA